MQGRVINCSRSVNVRSGPGTKYKKIGNAPKGAVYDVMGRTGSWYQINFNGAAGYLHNKYLAVPAQADPMPASGKQMGRVVNCKNSVNVRSGPGTRYKKAGSVSKGAVYEVTGRSGSWYAIVVNGRTVYISSKYLSVYTVADPPPPPPPPPPPTEPKIVEGYYGAWAAYSGYTPLNIPAGKLTHIAYAFALVGDDFRLKMGDTAVDPGSFARLRDLKAQYPHIQTLISVGSDAGAKRFSDMALSDGGRGTFADSAVAFMKEHGFDGVDIDWEYPTSTGRTEDKQNFTALMAKLREGLDAQGSADGRHYLLTFAGAWGTFYTDNVELNSLGSYVDFAKVMCYDMHMTGGGYTDFNSPLHTPAEPSPQYKWSCDDAIKLWDRCGFPRAKMVMGVPLYGYRFSGVNDANYGLYQTFSSGEAEHYDDIISKYQANPSFIYHMHIQANVPWLFDGSTFVSYDNPDSMALKATYIKNAAIGGAGVWELSQNTDGSLVGVLSDGLK